ncbi:diaminopropionate ammonia-lyase [Thalassospira sp. HF15]|uniref:diaminopropionate ammonia-lyase n=1 Tax=Thalassospira sp. HF15 TaxID=2722755 RepID=UPI0014322E4C|nr:diaminopropionate ammonia-lyase [Thalassospira sp. HF15]NIY74356.1 diaminopropionate ammonia-lyase [Thalassospira sp. HF15]
MASLNSFVPSRDEIYQAASLIASWPDYCQSPLVPCPGLAQELGIGAVWVKDESKRFGLGGVKALGAPYGLKQQLLKLGIEPGSPECRNYVAVAATDGNHGLATAWAAKKFNCQARIYVGSDVDPARMRRIRDNGAELVEIDGTYDDAVMAASKAAEADNILLITDTDYDGTLDVTRDIMAGYAMLGLECAQQLREQKAEIDCIFLQCGVGGMAAGCAVGMWHESGNKPTVFTVEPDAAACVKASIETGVLTKVPGKLLTRMVGLSCGCPSLTAFEILRDVSAGNIVIDDTIAKNVQDRLVAGVRNDPPLDTWDTGVSGIAGLWHISKSPTLRSRFGLTEHSRVLVINSEGAIPEKYL